MKRAILAGLIALFAVRAEGASLTVLSYDEPNGFGQAHNGMFNYWDGNYTGSGNKTTDGAPLTGGVGALTNGVITNLPWNQVENLQGTGPYVGWITIDPTITFHLANVVSYQGLDVYVDNSGIGGVSAPSAVTVSDGVHSHTFTIPNPGFNPTPIDLSLNLGSLGLTGNTVSVTLVRNTNPTDFPWVFAQEFAFSGVTGASVPEPASVVLLLLGVGLVGGIAVGRWRPGRRSGFGRSAGSS
jgi:hypothetical protein